MIRFLAFALVIMLGSACGQQPTTAAQTYVERLSKVLEVQAVAPAQPTLAFPMARDMDIQSPSATISVRDFLSMRQCELHTAIADKNSLLGKLAVPSQALFTDLKILRLAPACITLLKQDKQLALAEKLATALELKRHKFGGLLFKSILGQNENAKFWSPRPGSVDYPNQFDQRLASALTLLTAFVHDVKAGNHHLSEQGESGIEHSLSVLQQGDAGVLLNRLSTLSSELQRANQIIDQRLQRPLCLNGRATPTARNLQAVINTFFIAAVQTEAVALGQRYRQLMPYYLALEEQLIDSAPAAYQEWATQRQQQLQSGLDSSKKHVAKIQQIYSQCGLRAG